MRTRVLASLCSLAVATAVAVVTVPADAAGSAPRPSIATMTASSSAIKPAGVLVQVYATTRHARYCRLFVSPRVASPMTRPANCSKNAFQHAVEVPANTTPFVRTYRLTLKASGRGGSTYRTLVIKQVPDDPSITNKVVSPRRPDHYGGAITLSADLHSTVRCWLTATGGIKVSSTKFPCSGHVRRTVQMPENDGAYGRRYTVVLHARNPLAVTSSGFTLFQPAGPPSFLSFGSQPDQLGANGGRLTVSASFVNTQHCEFDYIFPTSGGGFLGACSGSTSHAFTIPANHSGKQHVYTFTLKLSGRGGKAMEQYTLIQPSS